MLILVWILVLSTILYQTQVQGLPSNNRLTNILGGLEQHASFSFIRPGLTQTAFAFNGPSSHQSFSSSIGDPHLAHRVLPNVAHALTYRNPGLGFAPVLQGLISPTYTVGTPTPSIYQSQPLDYQQNQALALSYQQQQQYQQFHHQPQPVYSGYASQIQPTNANIQHNVQQPNQPRVLATRFAILQAQLNAEIEDEQSQLQQEQQVQQQPRERRPNLLGIAYSSAPSVTHVKFTGNGYKFDF